MHLGIVWNQYYQLLENPAEFAAEVNRELVRIFGGIVTFAAAICGVFDASAGTVRLAGAGGPSPLVIHENQTAETIKAPGPPLGVMEDVPYQEQTVQLQLGDSLLLFSDGAFEIHNSENELLGVDGLARILQSLDYPQTPLNMGALAEELLKFSNEIRLQDDIAIIEVRFLGL
jgi:serine phosphatase RsbU (regulator of sigma subunit)